MKFSRALVPRVTEIRGVFFFERGPESPEFTSYSPPGHLIHFIVSGQVRQRCNEREYILRPGDSLWYHDNEFVEGTCLSTPWRFYSVVFDASSLAPPTFSARKTRPDRRRTEALFREMHRAWEDDRETEWRRALRCHAALSEILLLHDHTEPAEPGRPGDEWLIRLWWSVENQARQNLARPWRLADLADIGRVSPATIHRACMAAVKMPPVRRIKRLRLELGRGLLIYSGASITTIAARAGYERVNEFSRDLRTAYGASPSQIRKSAQKKCK